MDNRAAKVLASDSEGDPGLIIDGNDGILSQDVFLLLVNDPETDVIIIDLTEGQTREISAVAISTGFQTPQKNAANLKVLFAQPCKLTAP